MNQETNSETPAFWPRPLGTTAEHFRPTWQQWRDRQPDQGQPSTPEISGSHFSLDALTLDAFTARELNRLRFLRWLVETGRLTP